MSSSGSARLTDNARGKTMPRANISSFSLIATFLTLLWCFSTPALAETHSLTPINDEEVTLEQVQRHLTDIENQMEQIEAENTNYRRMLGKENQGMLVSAEAINVLRNSMALNEAHYRTLSAQYRELLALETALKSLAQ